MLLRSVHHYCTVSRSPALREAVVPPSLRRLSRSLRRLSRAAVLEAKRRHEIGIRRSFLVSRSKAPRRHDPAVSLLECSEAVEDANRRRRRRPGGITEGLCEGLGLLDCHPATGKEVPFTGFVEWKEGTDLEVLRTGDLTPGQRNKMAGEPFEAEDTKKEETTTTTTAATPAGDEKASESSAATTSTETVTAPSTATAEAGDAGEEVKAPGDEEDTGAQIAPIVRLEEVTISTGEENEDVLLDLKSKLYRFDKEGNQWKERGAGQVKLLQHKETRKIRLLMRQSRTLKICANHLVIPATTLQEHAGSDKTWVWHASDYSDGELKEELFCLRFGSVESAQKFKAAFEDAQEKAGKVDEKPDAKADEAAEALGSLSVENKKEKAEVSPAEVPAVDPSAA